jgi:hypothetical protein
MYTFNADAMLQNYQEHIDASANICTLVISIGKVGEYARNAIERSAASLDFGEIGWACIGGSEEQSQLTARDIWLLVEGLDPLRVVVCDKVATELFASAFKTKATHDSFCRIMCRNVVCFDDLDKLVQTDKQKVWALFKQI